MSESLMPSLGETDREKEKTAKKWVLYFGRREKVCMQTLQYETLIEKQVINKERYFSPSGKTFRIFGASKSEARRFYVLVTETPIAIDAF